MAALRLFVASLLVLFGCVRDPSSRFRVDPRLLQKGEATEVQWEDGTYSLTIAPENVPPAEETWDGALAWTYTGQAILSDEALEGGKEYFYETMERRTARDELMATTRVDSVGRAWMVSSIDDSLACGGAADCDLDAPPSLVQDDDFGTWEPAGWTHTSCSGLAPGTGVTLTENFSHFDGDDHDMVLTDTYTPEQKTSVAVYHWGPLETRETDAIDLECTGTLVTSGTVLTAAHCVTNEQGVEFNPSHMAVCTRGNGVS